jgi:hypothetical protein
MSCLAARAGLETRSMTFGWRCLQGAACRATISVRVQRQVADPFPVIGGSWAELAHPRSAPGVRRTLERRIRNWRALYRPAQEVIFPSGTSARPPHGVSDFCACATLAFPSRASGSSTGSITSGCHSRASNPPMSCSAAKALSPSPKVCRTPFVFWAARRSNIAATVSRPLPQSRRRRPGGRHTAV